jgi:hypothetical protein
MGIFDLFSRMFDDDQDTDHQNFTNFTNKVVKVVCKTHEDGVMRCTKTTQSSSDPRNHSYEETTEEYEQPPSISPGFEFNNSDLGIHFGIDHNFFSSIDRSFDNFFSNIRHYEEPSSAPPFFSPFQGRPHRFQSSRGPQNMFEKEDSTIYDI